MKYQAIKHENMLNGDGLRSVLWVSGCEAHCKGCFNPETWSFDDGEDFTEEVRESFVDSAGPDYISGITILGGEPLHEKNLSDVYKTLLLFKQQYPNKTVWLYTGFTWEQIFKSVENESWSMYEARRANVVAELVDVLVDGRFVEELLDQKLKWRGSSNQRVIDVKKSLEKEAVYTVPVLHCN